MEREELHYSDGNGLSHGRGCPKREVSEGWLMVSGDSGLLC